VTITLADGTMAAIFDAMPKDEWVSAHDVWIRLGVGAPSSVRKGLNELARAGKIEARPELLRGNIKPTLYLRTAA
jgi:hypothetical protein